MPFECFSLKSSLRVDGIVIVLLYCHLETKLIVRRVKLIV